MNALDVEIKVVDMIKETKPDFVIMNLSGLKFIDIDGIDCLKNVYKLKKTRDFEFGFSKMVGNAVFDKSDFV